MPLSHHPLVKEFPHHREQIHRLKISNSHFSNLMEQYEELDKQVFRIEDGSHPTSDEYVETLKRERLLLKDQLFEMINTSA
jgi:uncharacterized protein